MTPVQEAGGAAEPAGAEDASAAGRSRIPPGAGREKADELISLALRWLATVDSFAPLTLEARAQYSAAAVAKVQALLTGGLSHFDPFLQSTTDFFHNSGHPSPSWNTNIIHIASPCRLSIEI